MQINIPNIVTSKGQRIKEACNYKKMMDTLYTNINKYRQFSTFQIFQFSPFLFFTSFIIKKMQPSERSKKGESIINTSFTRYLYPNINPSCSTSSSNNEDFFTPTPTPSHSKNSLINPIPSISCKSAFSIQSFHTATGDYENDEEDQFVDEAGNTKRPFGSTLFVVDEERSSSNKTNNTLQNGQQKHQRPKILSTSSSAANDLLVSYPNGLSTTTTSNSMMIHPMSLVHSYNTSNSIPNNFFYYGSLDNDMLSKSPAGSYFHDYYSEDYEVVLDDGTLQKRSVSLSTMPISTPLEFNKKKYKGNYNHFYYQNGDDDFNRQKNVSRSQADE